MEHVQFTQMKDGTHEEYQFLHGLERQYITALPDRILDGLRQLDDGLAGYRVTRLEHSLQSATRAETDGADTDWVVAALVHDIGDALAPENHSQMAAAILRPYVREEVTWVVQMHGLFQQQYYGQHLGLDPDARDAYRDHPWFDSCQRFCARWDQAAFDPDYPTQALEHFEPLVREVFSRPAFAVTC
jgi:predicted HD phosphohydrolase